MGKGSKLLVVTGDHLDGELADYALNVAVRLDLEIVVLFVDRGGGAGDPGGETGFARQVEAEASAFAAQAWRSSVRVTTIVDSGDSAAVAATVCEQDPEIRFVLSQEGGDSREGTQGGGQRQRPRLSVIRQG